MFFIDDIIWLDAIVEKLMWKHRVMTSEVEEVLTGPCKVFKKEFGKVEGEHLYNALGRTMVKWKTSTLSWPTPSLNILKRLLKMRFNLSIY